MNEDYDVIMDSILSAMINKIDAMLKNLHQSTRRVAFYRNQYTTRNPAGSVQQVQFIWLDVKKTELPLLTVSRVFDDVKKSDLYFDRNTKMVGPHKIKCSQTINLDELVTIEKAIFGAIESDMAAIRSLTGDILTLKGK